MKAISLWEPWATAMAYGIKRNETRSWPTRHRGDLMICAAKRKLSWECMPAMEIIDVHLPPGVLIAPGKALCIVDLYDVVPSEAFYGATPMQISETESALGNYEPGRFIWLTRNLRRFAPPIPISGHQGLFDYPGPFPTHFCIGDTPVVKEWH